MMQRPLETFVQIQAKNCKMSWNKNHLLFVDSAWSFINTGKDSLLFDVILNRGKYDLYSCMEYWF